MADSSSRQETSYNSKWSEDDALTNQPHRNLFTLVVTLPPQDLLTIAYYYCPLNPIMLWYT